ncbi:amidohydrolase family protein [Fictibacillus sp. B-59209]|uniref:amidohydrolase family protein n=1 Tax=Fictibacillus sp. B-59209 TaxID=3024873 RepID=UPI002E22B9D0|nr:amidohydrolase family protein [Fictibacillus sp. B-59209]
MASCTIQVDKKEENVTVIPDVNYKADQTMHLKLKEMRKKKPDGEPLYKVYKDLPLIDVHNHQSPEFPYREWDRLGVDRTVLFGGISEPEAMKTDELAWKDYEERPEQVYPSFAGINIYSEKGIAYTRKNLENGYLNIGELAAASTYSPIVSSVKWKAETPSSGKLNEIYKLAGRYKVPVLLHIDPAYGPPIAGLQRVLTRFPKVNFIYAHANVASSPENIEALLSKYSNLFIDFYAGYTEYGEGSEYELKDFVPLMEKYPDRFLFGSDSGYGIGYDGAIAAIYEMIDLLSDKTAVKVAYQNYESLIERQPPTQTQMNKIKSLSKSSAKYKLNKREANELIMKLADKRKKEGS